MILIDPQLSLGAIVDVYGVLHIVGHTNNIEAVFNSDLDMNQV